VAPDSSPFTVRDVFFPYARESTDRSLEFILPSEHLVDDVMLQLRVQVSALPHGVEPGAHMTDLLNVPVRFAPTRNLSLVRVLIQDDWRGLPAPSIGEWQAALQGARTRFPVPDDGWEVRVLPGYQIITSDNDLSAPDGHGWDDLLEDLDDVAGDATDSWDHRWVGLLPAYRMGTDNFRTRGKSRTETTDRPWPLSNDYLVMTVMAGRPEVFAHELGHTFGFNHAGCPPGGEGMPADIDYSLPLFTDEVGFDTFAMTPFPAGSPGELMGYCQANGLWPSILTWTRMLDRLK
jgi:hypothetical protein